MEENETMLIIFLIYETQWKELQNIIISLLNVG